MKKTPLTFVVSVLMMLSLALGLCACGGTAENSPSEPAANSSSELFTLYDFDGWWYRFEGYVSEGISMVDIFKIDAAAGTWEAFDELGNGAGALPAYMEGDILYLQLGAPLDDAWFLPGGYDWLLNDEGEAEFVRGAPLDEPDLSSLAGRWFLSGDTSGEYYEFSGSSYKKCTSPEFSDRPIEEGSFTISSITLHIGSEAVIENVPQVELDGSFMSDDLYPTDDGCALINDFEREYYIHESAIGTPAGKRAVQYCDLIASEWVWRDDAGSYYLQFKHPGQFRMVAYPPEGGTGETLAYGAWSVTDGTVWLEFSDGDSDAIYLPDPMDYLALEYYGKTFERV